MRTLALVGLLGFLVALPGVAAAQSKCDSGKLKNTGKKLFGKEKVYSKAFKKNEAPDGAKLTKTETKFGDKCAKDETQGDCSATGNCAALEALADGCVTAINDEIANPGAESKCDSAKAKEAGKKYFCILKVHSKAAKKNEAPDAGKLAKCVTKFGDKCAKAESKGDCSSPGNCAALEALVDGCVSDTQDEVGGGGGACTCAASSTYTYTSGIGAGTCGSMTNFRCSNDANAACAGDGDCDFGLCLDPPGICGDNFSLSCSGAGTPCTGTCGQVGSAIDLDCGGLYTGGGGNSVPLPITIPDQTQYVLNVDSCSGSSLTLAHTTPGEATDQTCTQGRSCSGGSTNPGATCVLDGDCPGGTCDDNCLFGPPLPIPNTNSTPTSVCVVNVVGTDATGTSDCDTGAGTLDLGLRSVVHLAGDILSTSTGPIAAGVPGIQACPLCSEQCTGGSNDEQPCQDDSDCTGGGTCSLNGGTECIGGPSDGNPCTPASSALNGGLPTSHDCPPLASQDITGAIGGLPIAFAGSTGSETLQAVDQPESRRTFCGFCRDVLIEGSNCFDGDPDPGMVQGCPDSGAQANCDPDSGTTTGCGLAVACTDDSGCTAPYESCAQRNPGSFSNGAQTNITLNGSASGPIDAGPVAVDYVYAFCIPPTFDATVDAAGDLPGPGASALAGTQEVQ
jgi:hypothetical protein